MPVIPTSAVTPATSGNLLNNATGAVSASAAMTAGGDSFFAINKETIGILKPPMSSLLWRFEQYVKVDTQAQEGVDPKVQYPSTAKQLDLINMLAEELRGMNIAVEIGEKGHLTATIPSNLSDGKKAETIALFGHVDTSMDAPGANVKPTTHRNYQGGDIVLPGDNSQVIKESDYPELKKCIGLDIITSDGTTLLGADDKAGVAEIMTMADYLMRNPQLRHGEIKLVFTPDEEVGNDLEFFDPKKLGAKFAYTVDAGQAGEVEKETFCAYNVHVKIERGSGLEEERIYPHAYDVHVRIEGVNVHPGYAKGKMINSERVAAFIINHLPADEEPGATEDRRGSFYVKTMSEGNVGGIDDLLFRAGGSDKDKLKEKYLEVFPSIIAEAEKVFPGAKITVNHGYAKVINAQRVAAFIISRLPADQSPETTEGHEGYFHLNTMSAGSTGSIDDMFFLIRDFERAGLEERYQKVFLPIIEEAKKAFPGVKITLNAKNVYNNMVYAFDADSRPIAYAEEAMRQAGVKEIINKPVRGGTTGSKLSLPPYDMPTPNIFAGGMAFHGKREWVPTQWMDMSVYTLLNLAQIWAKDSK